MSIKSPMSIFVIADLHLSLGVDKPMHIFGNHWQDHVKTIEQKWHETVTNADTVVIPGDISWAMHLQDSLPDLQFIDSLPGQKILLRGNHDYWWSSLRKLEQFCAEFSLSSLRFLRHEAFEVEDSIICGTRGWILPDDSEFTLEDEKILLRELGRLQLSLESAVSLRQQKRSLEDSPLIAFMHYPPLTKSLGRSLFTDLLKKYRVDICCYGHIHTEDTPLFLQGQELEGIKYWLTAADLIDFKPLKL